TSSADRSTARSPTIAFTNIGKNVISAATTTRGHAPKPNQMISSGYTATIGVTFTSSAGGYTARSIARECAITTASANATTLASTRPLSAVPSETASASA